MYIFELLDSYEHSNFVYMILVFVLSFISLYVLVRGLVLKIKHTTKKDIHDKIISFKYFSAKLFERDKMKIIINYETPVAMRAFNDSYFCDDDLYYIAINSKSKDIRIKAIDYIHDINLLEDLKKEITNYEIRKRINKNILMEKTRLRSKHIREGLLTVRDNNSDEKLKDIALNNVHRTVRNEAISRISSDAVLFEILNKSRFSDTKAAAVNRISGVNCLKQIIYGYYEDSIRAIAVRRLPADCQSDYEKIAYSDKSETCRSIAVSKLNSDFLLGHIAINDKNIKLALLAVNRIRRKKVLAIVALKTKHRIVRIAASESITDDEEYKYLKEYCVDILNIYGSDLCKIIGHDFEYELSLTADSPAQFTKRHCTRCNLESLI